MATLDDKGVEAARIRYGFWLIISAFLLVALVSGLAIQRWMGTGPNGAMTTTDLTALIGSITGVMGTLVAAFFGIQAASGGRSQALDKIPSPDASVISYKIDPPSAPATTSTPVKITGDGLTGAQAVNFGTNPGTPTPPNVANDGLLEVNTPVASVGDVDVVVVFPDGKRNKSVGKFTFT
jgi:hypothetical protein